MIVYTAITAGKDALIEEQNTKGAEFVAFTNQQSSKTWSIRPPTDIFKDDRRNSRPQKFMPDKFFDTEYSLYIDGNVRLNVPMKQLVDEWLDGYDIAIFKHHARDCIYDEGEVVVRAGFDTPQNVIPQLKRYMDSGYGQHKGLCENGVILRRHTRKVREFGEAWFAEYSLGSKRDQLCAMYCADRVGLRINQIQGPNGENIYKHPYFTFNNHLTART